MTYDPVTGEYVFKDPSMEQVAKTIAINLKPVSILYFFLVRYLYKWYTFILQEEITQHPQGSRDSTDVARWESNPIHKALGRMMKLSTVHMLGIWGNSKWDNYWPKPFHEAARKIRKAELDQEIDARVEAKLDAKVDEKVEAKFNVLLP